MQGVTMFCGEFLMIFMFIYQVYSAPDKYKEIIVEAKAKGLSISAKKYFFLAIPASFDFLTSSLQYIALNLMPPSIYQMLRGGVVLVTALFSVLFLKRKLQAFHYLGCALVFGGVMLVGAANFIFVDDSASKYVSKPASERVRVPSYQKTYGNITQITSDGRHQQYQWHFRIYYL